MQWITATDTPSCGQKRHTRWPATTSKYWCAVGRSEKTHALARNDFRAADVPSRGQKRHTRWPATNSSSACCAITDAVREIGCNEWWLLITPSCGQKRQYTMACGDCQVLMCHRAVRKDTLADPPRIPSADVPPCWSDSTHTLACYELFGVQWITDSAAAIGCNEWRLLIRYRAVRKDTHDGLQRLPFATCAIVRSEETHTLARNDFGVLMCHQAVSKIEKNAGLLRILRRAMNYGCGSSIGCNAWRLLIRLSCGQKRHTRSACNDCRVLYVPSCYQIKHTRWLRIEF